MSRDLAGAIIAARRTHEAAVSVRAARVLGADADAFQREVDAQFQELATALGYLVTRDDPHSADGAETAATAPAN